MGHKIIKRNKNLPFFLLFLICLNVIASKRKIRKPVVGKTCVSPNEQQKLFFLMKNGVLSNKKRKGGEKVHVVKKGKKISELFKQNKVRPERKVKCYELNIRNDKKFSKFAKKPVAPISNFFYFSPFRNITDYFEPVDYDIKRRLRTEGFQFDGEGRTESSLFPSLNEIIEKGDPSKNIHYYRRKGLKCLLYGDPLKFVKTKQVIEKYNRKAPADKQINYEDFRCDIYYVHSNGTIMNIEENRPPYDKKIEESERYKEPRFIITAKPGHAKENNLKIGDKFPIINEEEKKKLFDNHFARPKKARDPLVLPDGRKIP